jgi:hypothetical protein
MNYLLAVTRVNASHLPMPSRSACTRRHSFSGPLAWSNRTDRAPNNETFPAAWMSADVGGVKRTYPFDVATPRTGRLLQHAVNGFERSRDDASYRSVHTNFLAIRLIGCPKAAPAMPASADVLLNNSRRSQFRTGMGRVSSAAPRIFFPVRSASKVISAFTNPS